MSFSLARDDRAGRGRLLSSVRRSSQKGRAGPQERARRGGRLVDGSGSELGLSINVVMAPQRPATLRQMPGRRPERF